MNLAAAPIRICFVAPKAYPLFNPAVDEVFGGAEVDLYLLAAELAKDKNFEVTFITADYGQKKIENVQDVTIIKSVDFKKNPLAGARRVWQAMNTADAGIYFQEASSWGTFLVALFCKLHKKIFVYRTANEGECDGKFRRQHFLAGKAFHWSLQNAKQVIVQNQIDKAKLQQTTGICSKVIPNAHHLSALPECGRNVILWVGRSAEVKRPELFIDLAEKTPTERFAMICQRATGDKKYEELVTRAGTLENLEFIERVAFDEIDSYFRRARVFVNTSSTEGFPNTFVQACKNAVPILSLMVNPDGFIDSHKCGMCANGNWDEFISQLNVLLKPEQRELYGRNARQYAEQNHNIEKIIEEYKKIFSSMASAV